MDVLIYDMDKQHACLLKEFCFQYFIKKNIEAHISEVEQIEQAYKILDQSNLIGVYILDVNKYTKLLAHQIRSNNQLNYVVLLSKEMGEMIAMIDPVIRPCGCIVKPIKKEIIEKVLREIWADYEEIGNGMDCFSFQIQGSYYSVAYEKILFFEGSNKKVLLRTQNQEYDFYDSLEHIQSEIPNYFMRIHKSFIVNLRKIQQFKFPEMVVYFEDDIFAYISRTYKSKLQEYILQKEEK
ncbi:MAG: LytTR family DNA-binding domain-containing protein [Lachnospiraceae bacterium]